MTREKRSEIYQNYSKIHKVVIGFVEADKLLYVKLGDNKVRTCSLKQMQAWGYLVINITDEDEEVLVNVKLQTISLRTIMNLCNGGPISDGKYDVMFWEMSGFWYRYVEKPQFTCLAKKVILRRLAYSLKNILGLIANKNLRYHFLLELGMVPLLHQMYGQAFPVDRERFIAELNSIEKKCEMIKKVLMSQFHMTEEEIETEPAENEGPATVLHKKYHKKRKLTKQFSVERLCLDQNSEISTTVNSIGTQTFRCTTRKINLYGLPSSLRQCLLPRTSDTIVTLDIHGSQVIILAFLANEQKLIRAYEAGKDIYKMMAAHFFQKKMSTISENERAAFKKVLLILINGGGISALSKALEEAGIAKSPHEVIKMKLDLLDYLPSIKCYINKLQAADCLVLPSGRYWNSKCLPESHKRLSRVLQGIESEIVKDSLIEISKKISSIPRTQLYMTVHDSISVETTLESKGVVVDIINHCLLKVFQEHFPEAQVVRIKEEN